MKKALLIFVGVLVVLLGGGFALFNYKNRGPELDLYGYRQHQDPVPEGKTAIFIIGLSTGEDFPGYDVYDVIDYPRAKWDEPYTKHFRIEATDIHYLGVPTGPRYRPLVAQAMLDALDSILSR